MQQFGAGANPSERVVQFVREHRKKLVLALMRLPQLLLGQNLLDLAARPRKPPSAIPPRSKKLPE
ncbi:hypothetical protein C8K18_11421 [Paraburkholderia sp. GV068]|nr:hypothetical protein [Paraburkholderia sp. GV072]PTQ96504.1 hypothetical protein C8K19_110255 [Paraburkholderia sp. GV072]PUB00760.1 hypothetical protein C8K18_11421 [Paraburkholderia sp. GV068]